MTNDGRTKPAALGTRTIRLDAADTLRDYAGRTLKRVGGRVREGYVEHLLEVPGSNSTLWVEDSMTAEGMVF